MHEHAFLLNICNILHVTEKTFPQNRCPQSYNNASFKFNTLLSQQWINEKFIILFPGFQVVSTNEDLKLAVTATLKQECEKAKCKPLKPSCIHAILNIRLLEELTGDIFINNMQTLPTVTTHLGKVVGNFGDDRARGLISFYTKFFLGKIWWWAMKGCRPRQ